MLQSFKMALKSIWGNKMRSFLTMLGIIIGVASVIILVSIVNGYMSYMVESFSSMGVNQITVQYHDKRMNDCLPPILFSAIFKLLKVLPDTELDAC